MPMKSGSKTITKNPSWPGPAISPGEILREEFLEPLGIARSTPPAALGSR